MITEFHGGIHLKFFPSKNARTNWNLLMRATQCYLHFIMHLVKEDRKNSQLNTTNNQRRTLLTNKRKARIVPGRRKYSEATKFGKKIYVIGDSHLNRIKRNIFKKSVNGGKTYFNVFSRRYI